MSAAGVDNNGGDQAWLESAFRACSQSTSTGKTEKTDCHAIQQLFEAVKQANESHETLTAMNERLEREATKSIQHLQEDLKEADKPQPPPRKPSADNNSTQRSSPRNTSESKSNSNDSSGFSFFSFFSH